MKLSSVICSFCFIALWSLYSCGEKIYSDVTQESLVGSGWANNSINTVIFRQNAVTSYKNNQFTAYYDTEGNLVLAKRQLPKGAWQTHITQYKANTADAHNAISMVVDNKGYIHVSWDHHDTKLRYAISKKPLDLELGEEISMTGIDEEKVSYPQFYNISDNGDLLFFYRSGMSGRGVLVMNSFDAKTRSWKQLHENLLDGEGERNAYWQAYVDDFGTIHVAWVWRESWDVATNHDIAYARSKDGGVTWEKSNGEKYHLPINAKTSEYAWKVPQNSSLINQTSITADAFGNPYIANYWNEDNTTQYQIVYLKDGKWKKENTGFRKTKFDLGGGGTKKIPISRPEILVESRKRDSIIVHLLFRDDERGGKISLASKNFLDSKAWQIKDLTELSVGDWEPNFDKQLYKNKGVLHIFKQEVYQVDGEGLGEQNATPVSILEISELTQINSN